MRLRQSFLLHAVILIVLLSSVPPLAAYRREYKITLDGVRKPGSEVCFYGADRGRDPFDLYFADAKVVCLPADDVLDIPPGPFHAFARHADGFVSTERDYFVYSGPPSPEAGYEVLETPIVPAATLNLEDVLRSAKASQHLGVWIAQQQSSAGTFMPVVTGETRMLVPAGRSVIPLVVDGHEPIAFGDPLLLDAGTEYALPASALRPRSGDLIAWLRFEKESGVRAATLNAPDILVKQETLESKPVVPLFDAAAATYTLLFFRNLVPGPATIEVHGRLWQRTSRPIAVGRTGVTVVKDPVQLKPGAALTATWLTTGTTASNGCKGTDDQRSAVELRLSRCERANADKTCTLVRGSTSQFGVATHTFESLTPGVYAVSLRLPMSAEGPKQYVTARAGANVEVRFPIDLFKFYGTVRRNGSPVEALLNFETGSARSDITGRYEAALAANPSTNIVYVTFCNDNTSAKFVPKAAAAPNLPFDIDLAIANVTVVVRDDARVPIRNAEAFFGPFRKMLDRGAPTFFYTSPAQQANDEGETTFVNVPADQKVVFCARATGYVQTCADPVVAGDLKKPVEFILRRTLQGSVIGHDGVGVLAWVTPAGTITEKVRVAETGEFSYNMLHAYPEHLVYASNRRPLCALPVPEPANGELAITLPVAAVRTFTVEALSAPPVPSTFVGVWVGDFYVPLQILAYHQETRGADVMLDRTNRLTISDVMETAPISVAIARDTRTPGATFLDVFTLPEFQGTHRYIVSSHTVSIP